MKLHKKAEAGLVIVTILIILIFSIGWLINVNQRECRTDNECGSESYCGSDFSCHPYPTIQKTIVQNNFLVPSIVIALAIVLAAIIFRWNKLRPKEEKKVEEHIHIEEVEDISEPYYKSGTGIKTP